MCARMVRGEGAAPIASQPSFVFASAQPSRQRVTTSERPHPPSLPDALRHVASPTALCQSAAAARSLRNNMHPASEPPAKRLRLLQSVDVDESNPDYIRSREQARNLLRTKFEGLFAKYENMTEEQSDDLDLQTGQIVVDRGHIRNNRRAWESAQYLDDIIGRAPQTERVECSDGSEDELALPVTPVVKGKGKSQDNAAPSRPAAVQTQSWPHVQSSPATHAANHDHVAPNAPLLDQTQLLNALAPALQLPQTPLGAQNQNALLIGLGQVVMQAVAHVLPQAQALTSQFGTTPLVTPRSVPTFQAAATSSTAETVAPATDPKWYFPPLPEVSSVAWKKAKSSPSRPSHTALQSRRVDSLPKSSPLARVSTIVDDVPPTPVDIPETIPDVRAGDGEVSTNSALSQLEKPRKRRCARFTFSKEDDTYILEQRKIHKTSWPQIRTSKAKWKDWPISAFHNHWYLHLRHDKSALVSPKDYPAEHPEVAGANEQELESSFTSLEEPRQLLTPSSLEHAELNEPRNFQQIATDDSTFNPGHTYSEEDLELLSLAGAGEEEQGIEEQEEQQQEVGVEGEGEVEGEDEDQREDEDMVEEQTEEESQQVDGPIIQETPPLESHCTSGPSIPPEDIIPSIELHDYIQVEYKELHDSTPRRSKVHVQIPYKPHDSPVESQRPRADSDDLDLVPTEDVDELAAPCPTTPRVYIKREPSTPGPSLFDALSAKTPKSAPHLKLASSSNRAATPRSGQSKKEFRRRYRLQWSRKPRKSTMHVTSQRSSEVLGKRKLADEDEDSWDELAC
ncbi:hypothetical protein K491DRAFT_2068 [Lophiostoma macrostomum CBS 122681]|uniref:Myb-like domain-containing protein n=1 Tax=Lophiostoma macrostomum CBS 122681 TaxID=1314788 RepID=A0A6A6TUW4_9PLEO|nr:hypothetical protein K491DRAFT_2068 [Lophiostoma macrostomum CBS 122681]